MKTILYILFLSILYSCNGQSISKSTQKIVDKIIENNQVECSYLGIGGAESEQYLSFQKLSKLANNKELFSLTDHKNGTVRCYAFQVLTEKSKLDLFPVLLKHLTDTTTVTTFCGCIMSSQSVGDYFLQIANSDQTGNDGFKLDQRQRTVLDSLMLFDDKINLSAKHELLRNIKPNPKYYNRIRQIALFENNEESVLALAKYRNKNDIEIIKKYFEKEETEYYATYAVREFPDSSFYPLLVNLFEKEWNKKLYDYPLWRMIYQSLAKYPNKETIELFERTTKTKDDFRYQTLCTNLLTALTKYPNALYDPLKKKIKLDSYHQSDLEQFIELEK